MIKKVITNNISVIFGIFASKEFPKFIQKIINFLYVKLLRLDMNEFKHYSEYSSLNNLFTRELIKKREINSDVNQFISPTDSFISAQGNLNENVLLQIKNMPYSIDRLLTNSIDENHLKRIRNGNFMNFYLSPKDYHRYHSSFDCTVSKLIHIPGKLYPVNFSYLKKKLNLFIENERVILECLTKDNKLFYMVFVGALNVGKMVFNFEPRVKTNSSTNSIQEYLYSNLSLKKGDTIGYFEMGSTVVMIWEKDIVELENLENKKVKFTQTIAKII